MMLVYKNILVWGRSWWNWGSKCKSLMGIIIINKIIVIIVLKMIIITITKIIAIRDM